MDPGKRGQLREVGRPLDRPSGKALALVGGKRGRWLHNAIGRRGKALRIRFLQRTEHIRREVSFMCSLLYDGETGRLPEMAPHLCKLPGEQFPKQRADTDVREEVPFSSHLRTAARVVTVLGVIERQFHEAPKRDRSLLSNLLPNH